MAVKSIKKKVKSAARRAGGRATGRRHHAAPVKTKTRHHVRRNPSGGMLASPPLRLGLWAGGGAAVSVALDRGGLLARVESPWIRGAIVALVLAVLSRLSRKATWRQGLTAAAVGAMVPAAAEGIGGAVGDRIAPRQLAAPTTPAQVAPPARTVEQALASARAAQRPRMDIIS